MKIAMEESAASDPVALARARIEGNIAVTSGLLVLTLFGAVAWFAAVRFLGTDSAAAASLWWLLTFGLLGGLSRTALNVVHLLLFRRELPVLTVGAERRPHFRLAVYSLVSLLAGVLLGGWLMDANALSPETRVSLLILSAVAFITVEVSDAKAAARATSRRGDWRTAVAHAARTHAQTPEILVREGTAEPPTAGHWWTDTGTRNEVQGKPQHQQVGRSGAAGP